jgi:hypothetical protein
MLSIIFSLTLTNRCDDGQSVSLREALVIDVEAEGLGSGIEVGAVDEERALRRTGVDRRHPCLDPNQQSDRGRLISKINPAMGRI